MCNCTSSFPLRRPRNDRSNVRVRAPARRDLMSELTGKVAIVTGAGRNIGRAIALALADAGASVLVNVRGNRAEAEAVVREIAGRGGRALLHVGDVADRIAVQMMAE